MNYDSYREYYLRNLLKSKGGEALENWCRVRAEHLLDQMVPQWKLEGEYCRIGSEGDEGRRMALHMEKFTWVDFADEEKVNTGVVSFLVEILGPEALIGLRTLWQQALGLGDKGSGMPIDLDAAVMPPGEPLKKSMVRSATPDKDVMGVWTYCDVDGAVLGKRVRLEDSKGEKSIWTWTYRTGGARKKDGKWYEIDPGWHWRGGWGRVVPPYGLDDFEDVQRLNACIKEGGGVLIVEGEKTRDAAVAWLEEIEERWRWLVLGLPGAGAASKLWLEPVRALMQQALDESREENVTAPWQGVVLWPDADADGIKAAERVAEKLGQARRVDVDDLASGGWNKWDLADEVPEGLIEVSEYENAHQWRWARVLGAPWVRTTVRNVQESAGDYVYVTDLDKFYNVEDDAFYSAQVVDRMNRTPSGKDRASLALLKDEEIPIVPMTTFKPGDDKLCWDTRPEKSKVVRALNLWEPGSLEPAKDCSDEEAEEKAGVFLDHMKNLIPDEREREHVLNWLAWQVQRQGEKVKHALLIQGRQGIGKSYIGTVMGRILEQAFTSISYEDMSSDFNGWERARSLVVIEEALAGGKKEFNNKMKTRITEDTVRINEKNMPMVKMHNRVNYIIFTNDRNPIYMEEDERRYFVYFSPEKGRSPEYYRRLFEETEQNIKYIYRWMLDRDLEGFDPSAPPPDTEGKREIQSESRPEWEHRLVMAYEEGEGPFKVGVMKVGDLLEWVDRLRLKMPKSSVAIGRNMKRLLGWENKAVKADGKTVKLWFDPELEKSWQEQVDNGDTEKGFGKWLVDRYEQGWVNGE